MRLAVVLLGLAACEDPDPIDAIDEASSLRMLPLRGCMTGGSHYSGQEWRGITVLDDAQRPMWSATRSYDPDFVTRARYIPLYDAEGLLDGVETRWSRTDGTAPSVSGVWHEDYDRGLLVARGSFRWEYDAAGRIVRSTTGVGSYAIWEYDGEGRVVAMEANASDGGGPTTSKKWAWDGSRLLSESTDSGDAVSGTTYVEHDADGRPTRFQSAGGNSLSCCWSEEGTWEWGPAGATRYTRGGVGEREWTWEGPRLTSERRYDRSGLLYREDRWTWDADGHVVEQSLDDGDTVERWSWDADELVAYELEIDGEWIETRWWSGCPTPRWPMPEVPVPGPWPEAPEPPIGYGG